MTDETINQSGQNIEGHQLNVAGANIGQIGDIFNVGDITGSYTVIAKGAQIIINQIEHALSAVDELDKGVQAAERILARAIQSKLDGYTQLPTTVSAEEGRNPYRSLFSYRIEDAPFFYGRREAIDNMLQLLDVDPLTVLAAISGAGKTSLLQAGLAARLLAANHLPLYVRPNNKSPQVAIKRAFLPDYITLDEQSYFRDDNMSLQGFLKCVTSYLGPRKLFIMLDQFEEFFFKMTPEKEVFAEDLRNCTEDTNLDVGWILSLREESFTKLRFFDAVRPFDNSFFLEKFKIEEARDVIIQPALDKGVRYEEGLVDQIINDISHGGETLKPVHVQLVCSTLFTERCTEPDPSVISADLYNRERGSDERKVARAEGILRSHLSRTIEQQLSGREQQMAWRILLTLVTSQNERAQRSRQEIINELQSMGDQAAVNESSLDHILKTLDSSRLVQFSEDDQGVLRYELAHEYLIEEINVEPKFKASKFAQEILDQEVSYTSNSNDLVLLAKDKYEIINSQLQHLHLNAESRKLIKKSEEHFEEERAKEKRAEAERIRRDEKLKQKQATADRLRLFALGLAVAVVIAVISTIVAIYFMNTAQNDAIMAADSEAKALAAEDDAIQNANLAATREAEARAAEEQVAILKNAIQASQLGQASRAELSQDQELALLLAATGLGLSSQPDTLAGFYDGVTAPYRHSLVGHTDGVNSASFSPDGMLIVTASGDNSAKVWDLIGNELASLGGHTYGVRSASFSPDGMQIVTASFDDFSDSGVFSAKLWDLNGNELASLDGHTGMVISAGFSPNGTQIVTASYDGSAKVWDLTGNELVSLDGHTRGLSAASFSPDGSQIVTAGGDSSAKVWDINGNQLASLNGHTEGVNSASFSPDGTQIVTASHDGSAKLWDLTGNELASLDGHTDGIWSASFSPDGTQIVTASYDNSAKVWDINGNELASLDGHKEGVLSAVFSPDGTQIVTASRDGSAKVWALTGNELASLVGHSGTVSSASFSPDGTQIVTGSWDGCAKVWDLTGHEPVYLDGHSSGVNSASFSPDGTQIVMGSWDGSAKVWDINGIELASLDGHTGLVGSARFNPVRTQIVTGSWDGSAKVWDTNGSELASLEGHTDRVNSASFSPDGKQIVTASEDGSAKLWDLTGNELTSLDGHTGGIWSASFSPDGAHIVTASADGTDKVWDLSGNELTSLEGHTEGIGSVSFSPDGTQILTANGVGGAKVWDLKGNKLVTLDRHTDGVWSGSFSPDGSQVVIVSGHGAKVWDLAGNELASLDGHAGVVYSASFSPDGTQIVTTSRDGSVKVWDINGNELASLDGISDLFGSASFSPDGTQIVAAMGAGGTKVWNVTILGSSEEQLANVRARLTRGFTDEECRRFFRDDLDSCPQTAEEVLALFDND